MPRAGRAVWIPGGVYFATRSPVWEGGRALYDPGVPGRAAARAYLITAQQFSDVAAQEMYREPGADLDLSRVVAAGRDQLGTGRYETLICTGLEEGVPRVTFTGPWGWDGVPLLRPSARYLRMLAQGLGEAHGWGPRQAADYLSGLPGARGAWTAAEIVSLLDRGAAAAPGEPGHARR